MLMLRPTVFKHSALDVFNGLTISHYTTLELWYPSPKFSDIKIGKTAKRAVSVNADSKYTAHSEPLFKFSNILNVADLCHLYELKYCYKT